MEGLLYGPTSQVRELCLLEHSINYCEWTVSTKTYNMFYIVIELIRLLVLFCLVPVVFSLNNPGVDCWGAVQK